MNPVVSLRPHGKTTNERDLRDVDSAAIGGAHAAAVWLAVARRGPCLRGVKSSYAVAAGMVRACTYRLPSRS